MYLTIKYNYLSLYVDIFIIIRCLLLTNFFNNVMQICTIIVSMIK